MTRKKRNRRRENRPLPRKTQPKQPPPKRQREPPRSFDSARTLERSGKTEQALANYREVVKDYANTPSAKTAAERIKAIEKE